MIDLSKSYKTFDGHEVRLYATDGATPWSVHGAIKNNMGYWETGEWDKDGNQRPYGLQSKNLIEVTNRNTKPEIGSICDDFNDIS